jgi:hypothetical protein
MLHKFVIVISKTMSFRTGPVFPNFNHQPIIPEPLLNSLSEERERLKEKRREEKRLYKEKYPLGSIQADREEVINFMISRHPSLNYASDEMLCKITEKFLEALTNLQC